MTITINGRDYLTTARTLTYEEIARIADQGPSPTVTYRVRDSGVSGELAAGDVIGLSDGLTIDATSTENA